MCSLSFNKRLSGRFRLHEIVGSGDIDNLVEFARTSSQVGVNDYDDEGQAPLHLAADKGIAEAVGILTGHGANIDVPREEDNRTPLHIAVNEGHADVVTALLDAGAQVNSEDYDGWLALHVACYYGAAKLADMMLRHGAQVMACTNKGQTPLHIAVEMAESRWHGRDYNYGLTIQLLLGAGAAINAADSLGSTPLQAATNNLDLPTMRLLLQHDADVSAAGAGGRTPLHTAVSRGSSEAAELLLGAGADINAPDEAGATPLMLAVEGNCPSMIKWLLEHGADPHAACGSGWRAAHLAVRLGRESCLVMLLQEVPSLLDEEDEAGLTPLHTAAEAGAVDTAELLLDRGAELNRASEPRRITALHVAAYHNQEAAVAMLLGRGIAVNVQDANGHTSLHIAALLNHHHLIGPLLAARVDARLTDKSGRTAQQLALDKGSGDKQESEQAQPGPQPQASAPPPQHAGILSAPGVLSRGAMRTSWVALLLLAVSAAAAAELDGGVAVPGQAFHDWRRALLASPSFADPARWRKVVGARDALTPLDGPGSANATHPAAARRLAAARAALRRAAAQRDAAAAAADAADAAARAAAAAAADLERGGLGLGQAAPASAGAAPPPPPPPRPGTAAPAPPAAQASMAVEAALMCFVRRTPRGQLTVNGRPWLMAGVDVPHALHLAASSATRPALLAVMDEAARLGLNTLRVAAHADGGPGVGSALGGGGWPGPRGVGGGVALQPAPGVFNATVLAGLDWLVQVAGLRGLRLVLVLSAPPAGEGDAQEWPGGSGGGMAQFTHWVDPGLTLRDFYANDTVKLADGPSHPGHPGSEALQGWLHQVGSFVKDRAPHQLLLAGLDGTFGASSPHHLSTNPAAEVCARTRAHCPGPAPHARRALRTGGRPPTNAPARGARVQLFEPASPSAHAHAATCSGVDFWLHSSPPQFDLVSAAVMPDRWVACELTCKLEWTRAWVRAHLRDAVRLQRPLLLAGVGALAPAATRARVLDVVQQEVATALARGHPIAGVVLAGLAHRDAPASPWAVPTSAAAARAAPSLVDAVPQVWRGGGGVPRTQAAAEAARRRFMGSSELLACLAAEARGGSEAGWDGAARGVAALGALARRHGGGEPAEARRSARGAKSAAIATRAPARPMARAGARLGACAVALALLVAGGLAQDADKVALRFAFTGMTQAQYEASVNSAVLATIASAAGVPADWVWRVTGSSSDGATPSMLMDAGAGRRLLAPAGNASAAPAGPSALGDYLVKTNRSEGEWATGEVIRRKLLSAASSFGQGSSQGLGKGFYGLLFKNGVPAEPLVYLDGLLILSGGLAPDAPKSRFGSRHAEESKIFSPSDLAPAANGSAPAELRSVRPADAAAAPGAPAAAGGAAAALPAWAIGVICAAAALAAAATSVVVWRKCAARGGADRDLEEASSHGAAAAQSFLPSTALDGPMPPMRG
ncbi:ANK3 [Scenedesmus sp. PABB004]|nr:ANK3 [Scenedesmus sp. PABB004]